MPTAETIRDGRDVYEQFVRPHVRPEDDGKFVAIDELTGSIELDENEVPAIQRLRARLPGAKVWLLRVGHPGTYYI